MRIEVSGSPEHENASENYAFIFNPATLHLHLTGYFRYTREHETAPWERGGFWQYPDLRNESTLKQPEAPAWAIADAKTYILTQIQFLP